jgi:hypothetical protein
MTLFMFRGVEEAFNHRSIGLILTLHTPHVALDQVWWEARAPMAIFHTLKLSIQLSKSCVDTYTVRARGLASGPIFWAKL